MTGDGLVRGGDTFQPKTNMSSIDKFASRFLALCTIPINVTLYIGFLFVDIISYAIKAAWCAALDTYSDFRTIWDGTEFEEGDTIGKISEDYPDDERDLGPKF